MLAWLLLKSMHSSGYNIALFRDSAGFLWHWALFENSKNSPTASLAALKKSIKNSSALDTMKASYKCFWFASETKKRE